LGFGLWATVRLLGEPGPEPDTAHSLRPKAWVSLSPVPTGSLSLKMTLLGRRLRRRTPGRAHAPSHARRVRRQGHLLAPAAALREAIERDVLQSIILWARRHRQDHARAADRDDHQRPLHRVQRVLAGIKDIKAVMAEAEELRRRRGRRTILFVDRSTASTRRSRTPSSPRRGRRHRPGGCDHREPSFEVKCGAALAFEGVRAEPAAGGRPRVDPAAGAHRRGARPRDAPRAASEMRWARWRATRTGMRAWR